MEPIFTAFQTIDPMFALAAGIALGIISTLAVVLWKPQSSAKNDPLSNLFTGDTLQSQISRVADQAAQSERADREASAVRAKLFARKAAQKPVPPHRAENFDHAAVLDHIAKVMRAGSEIDKSAETKQPRPEIQADGQWEEVLLLPAPTPTASDSSKAA